MLNADKLYDYKKLEEKYLKFAKSKGINYAITELHNEIGKLEKHIFDYGYHSNRLEVTQKLRELSRKIWSSQFDE
jgi:hypothetical protein